MHSLSAGKSSFKALLILASPCGLLADGRSRLMVGLAYAAASRPCQAFHKFIRMALVFSLVFFPAFSTAIDFRFQTNFIRPQVINQTIVHLDSDSFDIPFEVIFELRKEVLCLI